MKYLIKPGIITIFTLLLCIYAKAENVRIKNNINREWKYNRGDIRGAELPEYGDGAWENVSLPHSFSIPYFMGDKVYHGYGWYRKKIDIPKEWKSKTVTLEFEGSFIETEVYVNGRYAGKHVGGYTGFCFDITKYIAPGSNSVAVRVNNLWNARVAPRTGDHQFSGGIYRDVYLNVTDNIHVGHQGTFFYTPQVNKESATCEALIEIRNNSGKDENVTVKTEIKSPDGKTVSVAESKAEIKESGTVTLKQIFPAIKNPELWSPETPKSYKGITTVTVNGKKSDEYETTFGIRWFEWTKERGFFLNGEHYYLLGANVHQDQAGWGDAVTNAAMRRDVQMIKDAGFNCIRGSHYPHDPAFAKACDEIGIILFMENALWGMGGCEGDRGWSVPPSGCYPPKPEDQPDFDQSVLEQLKEMILIHRNSPSIASWSMCNEPFFTDDSTDGPMKRLLNTATDSSRIWDPTREVAIGGSQRRWIDRLGKNAIAFYNGDGASREEFQNPGVPNLVSEYGSVTTHRPGTFSPGWGDIENGWNRPEWRSGQIIWCGFDHGTIGGTALATMGLIDYFRLPKRQYYWYAEAYKGGDRNPAEPEWPETGVPAKLSLTASNTVIEATDGTDDTQLTVTVLDKAGKHISNEIPVKLSIVSGPGEFPTGRSITFTPPSDREESDISIRDGQAAIAFRSYHSGKTVIEAAADGVEPAVIEITTKGHPVWKEGVTQPVPERPYKRYSGKGGNEGSTSSSSLAVNRPSWVSSSLTATNKANVNDSNLKTIWRPAGNDGERWWKLFLEASYCIDRIEIDFPEERVYKYLIETSKDGISWETADNRTENTTAEVNHVIQGDLGCNIAYVRVKFISETAGLAEVKVTGSLSR